jgi:hypothetical protein
MTNKFYQENGFAVSPKLIPVEISSVLLNEIEASIAMCINEIGCSEEEYLSSVNRWATPSIVTDTIEDIILEYTSAPVKQILGDNCFTTKFNIISKTRYCRLATVCHQDISYNANDPYNLSVWVALNDVEIHSGALQFLPGSHRSPISPPVDFWQPDYFDTIRRTDAWQKQAITVPVKKGDAIIFDSRIWHGSTENINEQQRFAAVSRWSVPNFIIDNIPEFKTVAFGMQNCSNRTLDILNKAGMILFNQDTSSLVKLISSWEEYLQNNPTLPFICNYAQVLKALKQVRILNLGHKLHNGGDSQGVVYSNLWNVLLVHLQNWLQNI